jgi:CheY-like chemotaxis protein
MESLLSRPSSASKRVTVIDGSTGLRLAIAALVQEYFPDAIIEDIDPFSQTMRGPGFSFSTSGSAIVLGGVGTEAEANDALKRLRSRANCPPIIMLVAEPLMRLRESFVAAGAFDVLRKDAVSGQRLRALLSQAFESAKNMAPSTSTSTPSAPAAGLSHAPAYGKFLFVDDGERVGVDIDSYRPVSVLSSGKMAQVYLSENIATGQQAVVKILTSAPMRNVTELTQLLSTAAKLRPIRGSSVVREYDSGIAANFPYIAMEFLPKGDLRRRMKQAISVDDAVTIIRQILAALGELHRVEICHADLKPESVFFREVHGSRSDIALIDFNISTPFGKAVRHSPVGDVLGTPTYMSPEQGAGSPVTAASDIYSAGVIFFELLAGIPPFTGDTAAQTIFRHLHHEIPLLPMKSRHLQPVVDQMLAKHADDRFQTAADVLAAIDALPASD